MKRGPLIPIIATLGFLFLYAPIVWLVVFSFNDNRLVTVWGGFTTRWYGELFQNEKLLAAAREARRRGHHGHDDHRHPVGRRQWTAKPDHAATPAIGGRADQHSQSGIVGAKQGGENETVVCRPCIDDAKAGVRVGGQPFGRRIGENDMHCSVDDDRACRHRV